MAEEVVVKGWVYKRRKMGAKIFIDLRTVFPQKFTGQVLQVVVSKESLSDDEFNRLKKITQESALEIKGILKEEPRAPGGVELHVNKVLWVNEAESPYPLGKKAHSPDVLLRNRHLTIRSPRYQKILIIREKVTDLLREWFKQDGWYEVFPPILVFTAAEGGATLFKVDYFEEIGFLSQSAQLYLEALIFSLGKVFSLTPSFRAEKSRTPRHLTEFWHFEAEGAWYRYDDIMRAQESAVAYTIKKLLEDEKMRNWIKEFRGDISILENIKLPFPRIKYSETIDILQSKGFNISWGDDLGADEEKALSEEFEQPFFVTHYPTAIKAFYVKETSEDPKICYSADLMAPEGYGEITTGGEREENIDRLIERIKREGFDPELYYWYLDLRRYGSVPHSGFGLGIERFMRWLLKLYHIRDTVPFPRLARRKELV